MPDFTISRRAALARLAALTAIGATGSHSSAEDLPAKTGLGLVVYDCAIRREWLSKQDPSVDLFEPLRFLEHCQRVGAGGIQAPLGVLDVDRVRALRDLAEKHALFIDGIVNAPKDETDVVRFAAEIRTAAEVGAIAVRTTVIPGRRYEQFSSLAEFRAAETKARRSLELAAPVVERYRMRLAVENHKDQRIDERLALYEHIGSEYIGACVDTGNSFALLDDPYQAVEALAPYAFTVHLKDQAVREYGDGFLLGDIPLGKGCFDLKRIIAALRRAKPSVRMVLELITRDPLQVPCLTEKYWSTMPDVPGRDLADALRFVRRQPAENLQSVSPLPLERRVELEDANIATSLKYARESLAL